MISLDLYDEYPLDMIKYLKYYGWHFNKKMCEFAVSRMIKNKQKLLPVEKERIDVILKQNNITLNHNELWDYVYVFNLGKADHFGTILMNDIDIIKYVKDVIDDEDGYNEMPFSHFYIDTVKKGIPIDWEEML